MDELLCSVDIIKRESKYIARVQSQLGGIREYQAKRFEDILEQLVMDLQEEFEGLLD